MLPGPNQVDQFGQANLEKSLSVRFASGAMLQSRGKLCGQQASLRHPVRRRGHGEHSNGRPRSPGWRDSDGEEISEEKPGPMDDTQHRVASGPSALNHGEREGKHPSLPTRIPYPHPAPIPQWQDRENLDNGRQRGSFSVAQYLGR